ncbi:hypothetical protein ACFC8N_08200 [Streptomyces sp. NPDC055966]|uniref:hypothetical protein n=1 Tax=Streptomyces sp. NPDC055966 TaxID=3345669 RepID=UPI0035DCB66F
MTTVRWHIDIEKFGQYSRGEPAQGRGVGEDLNDVGPPLTSARTSRRTTSAATNLLETDLDVWTRTRTFDVNVIGHVRTARAVLPHLLENAGAAS